MLLSHNGFVEKKHWLMVLFGTVIVSYVVHAALLYRNCKQCGTASSSGAVVKTVCSKKPLLS